MTCFAFSRINFLALLMGKKNKVSKKLFSLLQLLLVIQHREQGYKPREFIRTNKTNVASFFLFDILSTLLSGEISLGSYCISRTHCSRIFGSFSQILSKSVSYVISNFVFRSIFHVINSCRHVL